MCKANVSRYILLVLSIYGRSFCVLTLESIVVLNNACMIGLSVVSYIDVPDTDCRVPDSCIGYKLIAIED